MTKALYGVVLGLTFNKTFYVEVDNKDGELDVGEVFEEIVSSKVPEEGV